MLRRVELDLDQRLKIVTNLMSDDLRRDLSLSELARHVKLSPSRLRELFKTETGMSRPEYLTALRTQKAKELIETTSLSIHEIRLRVGLDKD